MPTSVARSAPRSGERDQHRAPSRFYLGECYMNDELAIEERSLWTLRELIALPLCPSHRSRCGKSDAATSVG